MGEPLVRALARVRGLLLAEDALVRAVASGRQKGRTPRWRRVELRYVDLKAGRRLQVTAYDQTQAHTRNHEPGNAARDAVDALFDEPFANWHVETTTETHQLRVTKKLDALVHTSQRTPGGAEPKASAEPRAARPQETTAAARGPSAAPRGRDRRPGGPGQAQPAGEVPAGRGVPAQPRRPPSTTPWPRVGCGPRRRTSRCAWSTWAAATPI